MTTYITQETLHTAPLLASAPTSDLALAVSALSAKQKLYTKYWQYYDGIEKLPVPSEKIAEIFEGLDVYIAENWCETVIDACNERINLTGLAVAGNDELTTALNKLWHRLSLGIEADDAHLAALICGESFIVGWKDAESGQIQLFHNDPRLCHMQYRADNPREKAWAAKWWYDQLGQTVYLTLYYPDRLEYYAAPLKSALIPDNHIMPTPLPSIDAFEPYQEPATNPFGMIPVFHFQRDRRGAKSDLLGVIPIQDAVNISVNNMMIAEEFAALPQKWVISQTEVKDGIRISPKTIMDIPANDGEGQDTSVGQFAAANMSGFLEVIDHFTTSIAAISRTPKHYFLKQGGDPSGEALIAMEAPLVKKASNRIERFTTVWRQIGAFLLALLDVQVDAEEITPHFDPPETVQPLSQATIISTNVGAGIPLVTAVRRVGWTDDEITQLEQDRADAAAQALKQAQAMQAVAQPATTPQQPAQEYEE